ncbi:hypothetical protein OS493_038789 [Desmophyllum pertusum]|uniref:Uncharacterized protein n=1 Tax=Desmophyllum pertusum TaxID=174260 RepID=A0A9W9YU14_9CNID|nr:hypothetical protein OS493_038789 [Desmophyllum pertusum]
MLTCAELHKEHDYCVYVNQPVIYDEAILTPRFSGRTEDIWHSVLDPSKVLETAAARVNTKKQWEYSVVPTRDREMALNKQFPSPTTFRAIRFVGASHGIKDCARRSCCSSLDLRKDWFSLIFLRIFDL